MLTPEQIQRFTRTGHLTVEGVFPPDRMELAIEVAHRWGEEFLGKINEDQRHWYLEGKSSEVGRLRKMDNPVYHQEVFRDLACDPRLVEMVEQLIGRGVRVFFSQVFFKPPEGGGPKPIHQDNYYFGPDQRDAMVTAWIALDEATVENGCLFYGDGSNAEPILEHTAPPDQPFNLHVPGEIAARYAMTPAPVRQGGVSFHHGHTLHQSSSNTSRKFRRAAALHFLRNDARLVNPRLDFDPSLEVVVGEASGEPRV